MDIEAIGHPCGECGRTTKGILAVGTRGKRATEKEQSEIDRAHRLDKNPSIRTNQFPSLVGLSGSRRTNLVLS